MSLFSLSIGGIISFVIVRNPQSPMAWLISFSFGLLMFQITARLLPESANLGGWVLTSIGTISGYLLFVLIQSFSKRVVILSIDGNNPLQVRSGMLIALAIALHNLPAGFALGSISANKMTFLSDLYLTMAVHSLPEGIILGLPFAVAGLQPLALFICVTMASFPTGIGALFGMMLGNIPQGLMSYILGLAVGTMIYVALHEMIQPVFKKFDLRIMIAGTGLGVISGLIFL